MERINIDELAKSITKGLKESEIFDTQELILDLKKSKLDFTKEYQKPISLIQMVEDNKIKKDVLTTSNISCTIGGAKSKKTFFATMILASLLGYKDFAINGQLLGLNVVFFDTEQSFYHVQKISYRLKKMLNKNLSSIEIYALRPFTPEKRLALIDYYLSENKGKYSFVIIDGVVDLLYDFNDLKESKKISTKLMEWSANYNCHINVVLHTNKDQNYARGHLGTELMNKSETVFRITKDDNNISRVTNDASRNEGFNEFTFTIEEGLPKRLLFPSGYYNNEWKPEKLELIDNSAGFTHDDIPF